MLATHQEAEHRYDSIRRVALSAAQRAAPAGLRYELLTPAALNAAVAWAGASDRLVTWDWFSGYSAFKFRYPKRFELALWEHSFQRAFKMRLILMPSSMARLEIFASI